MGKPAARVGDNHTCPETESTPAGDVPHAGGPIQPPGCKTVVIDGQPAARIDDQAVCVGPTDTISAGSATVIIDGKKAARMGDDCKHGGKIAEGCETVMIGD